jgi:hypothetical protein
MLLLAVSVLAHACTCRRSITLPALTKQSRSHRVPTQVSKHRHFTLIRAMLRTYSTTTASGKEPNAAYLSLGLFCQVERRSGFEPLAAQLT